MGARSRRIRWSVRAAAVLAVLGLGRSLPADLVLVDLEDGVAPADKDEARDNVRSAIAAGFLTADHPWMLRVNGGRLGPPAEDLTLVGFAKPAIVVVPKAEDPEFVGGLAARFAGHGAATALMIETPAGVACAMSLMNAHPSVCMAIFGSADLRASLGARPGLGRAWEAHALSHVLLAARRFGRVAIDSVYFRYRDDDGLRSHSALARELGYDGKSCIHPHQVATIHDVYASNRRIVQPSASHVRLARGAGEYGRRGRDGVRLGPTLPRGTHPVREGERTSFAAARYPGSAARKRECPPPPIPYSLARGEIQAPEGDGAAVSVARFVEPAGFSARGLLGERPSVTGIEQHRPRSPAAAS
jgi:citrate lyase beta subunit